MTVKVMSGQREIRSGEGGADIVLTSQRRRGRFLVRGGKCEQIEGDYLPTRHVIVEFESMERLKEFYHSDTYAPALAIRLAISTGNAYAVETL